MIEAIQIALTMVQAVAFVAAILKRSEDAKPERWLFVAALAIPVWILEVWK